MYRYSVVLLILFSASISPATIFSPKDIEWATAVTGTLHMNEVLTNGEYKVKAVQFASPVPGIKDIKGNIVPEYDVDPMVVLEIYKKGVLIKQIIMTEQSEPYIDPDYEVKVSATEFMPGNAKEWVFEYYNPWVKISIQLRGKPKLEVSVSSDKTSYTSYDDHVITSKVEVKNTGDAFAKNVDVNLDIGELKLRGGSTSQLHQYYYKIEKGESRSYEVILLVPKLIDENTYTLKAEVKGFDVKGLEYNASTSLSLTVSPKQNYLTVSKAVSKDRIYLTDTIFVRIIVTNSGMFDAYDIQVNDSMEEHFELLTDTSLSWFISRLEPGQEWSTVYSIKPLETNLEGFTLPVATAQFMVNNKKYHATSQTPKVIVNGPKIILNKTVDKSVVGIGEDVTVTVNINNVGNIPTRVLVKDFLPDGVSFVRGNTSLTTFLEVNKPKMLSYVIRMDKEGVVQLPHAIANYTGVEYIGIVHSKISSNVLNITVIDPSKITSLPTQTSNQEQLVSETPIPANETEQITPGFEIMFAAIAIMFIILRRIY